MDGKLSRRGFLISSAAAGVGLLAAGQLGAEPYKTRLRKAVIIRKVTEDALKNLKDAGFEGVEAGTVPADEAKQAREIAEKLGMRIHSVIGGGAAGLRACQAYGGDALLHVPGGVSAKPMPEPWEFDIEFDEKTGHIARVVKGDNEKFKAYIEAHNRSMDSARESTRKLIAIAEEAKVVIALENVWNNFCVRPELFKWLVASFQSPWVKAYFDIGNHVKYSVVIKDGKPEFVYPPEVWIRSFGPLLAKVHMKDYNVSADGKGGDFCGIGQGSVNWPAVRQALDDVGYNGWLTDESGGAWPDLSKRFDLVIAGKDPGRRDQPKPAPR
jgi:L-ribulose-5-phosphate 3-epimerase